jgi:hypothetical protein
MSFAARPVRLSPHNYMRKYYFLATLLAGTLAFAAPDTSMRYARPGTLNYVEGQASIENQNLNAKSIGTVELQPGQAVTTGAGKVEVLLTPGVFVRLSDHSRLQMVAAGLTDTEVELQLGRAMIEVAQIRKENNLTVLEKGSTVHLLKTGLYGFDANRNSVQVFDGKAELRSDDGTVDVKGGHEVILGGSTKLKSESFDKKAAQDDLYRWSSLRSSYLADASEYSGSRLAAGGWYGPGWYWSPWYGSFTWLPGDPFFSPFGWGYYPPVFIYPRVGFFRSSGGVAVRRPAAVVAPRASVPSGAGRAHR